MNINIDFFSSNLIKAIGTGIYEVTVEANGNTESLYIGESVFVLVRCATHLYELNKNPNYFGFTKESIEDSNITLKFQLLNPDKDYKNAVVRKTDEKQAIKDRSPLCQNKISDRMKDVDEKIEALENFLNQNK